MLAKLNLSKEEIRLPNYERFHYPCPKIQKRVHVIYPKATRNMSNVQTARILDIHFNSMSRYTRIYKEGGFEELRKACRASGIGRLKIYKESIIADFNTTPVCSISQVVCRIKVSTGIERLWKFAEKQILYALYYDTAEKLHVATVSFFGRVNNNFRSESESSLTLKFQLFEDVTHSQKQVA